MLRNTLLELQKNLLKCIADKNSGAVNFEEVRELLVSGKQDDAIEAMRQICFKSDNSPSQMVETLIDQMIKKCDANNDFSFKSLQSKRVQQAAAVDPTTIVDMPAVLPAGNFECPISMEDDDHPTLYIRENVAALSDISKQYMDAIITNPFMMLDDKSLVANVESMLDHVVGYNTTKEMYAASKDGKILSPFSNQPIACALLLGKRSQFDVANNFVLARCFFGD